jgi:hypothetical protein
MAFSFELSIIIFRIFCDDSGGIGGDDPVVDKLDNSHKHPIILTWKFEISLTLTGAYLIYSGFIYGIVIIL